MRDVIVLLHVLHTGTYVYDPASILTFRLDRYASERRCRNAGTSDRANINERCYYMYFTLVHMYMTLPPF